MLPPVLSLKFTLNYAEPATPVRNRRDWPRLISSALIATMNKPTASPELVRRRLFLGLQFLKIPASVTGYEAQQER